MKHAVITNVEIVEYQDFLNKFRSYFLVGATLSEKKVTQKDFEVYVSLNRFLETLRAYRERNVPEESTPIKTFKEKYDAILVKMNTVLDGVDEDTLDMAEDQKNKVLEYTNKLNKALHIYCEERKVIK